MTQLTLGIDTARDDRSAVISPRGTVILHTEQGIYEAPATAEALVCREGATHGR